jgi:hypothetical protein
MSFSNICQQDQSKGKKSNEELDIAVPKKYMLGVIKKLDNA